MPAERREVVVVGAGLVGLSVAAELAVRGRDVLCLEQASVGHPWSGSKGDARIFRLGYDDPLYVEMARRCLEGWGRLAERAGEALLVPCGMVSFGGGLEELAAAMREAGGDPEELDAGEAAARFEGLSLPGAAVVDPSGGVLLADRVLTALAATDGLELREGARVASISGGEDSVVVRGAAGEVEASAVVVCAGPATPQLLGDAGLACSTRATLEQVAYFRVTGGVAGLPALAWRAAEHSPGEPERLVVYGLPSPAQGTYKLGLHYVGPEVVPGSGRLEAAPALTGRLIEAATSLLVGVDPEPALVERCVYDNTSDGDFLLDRSGRIVVGAGTSGHGFKFGPVLGRILADLALGETPEVDVSRFALR
jgi:sarcosine oxidase